MTKRARRPASSDKRSKRISSRSLTTKAAPQSTSHSHITTESSEVQPTGKLRKYRKTIWMMNAKNIAATIAAAMFSARRRNQAPASRIMRAPLLQRVDLLEHALGPLLGLVGSQVD